MKEKIKYIPNVALFCIIINFMIQALNLVISITNHHIINRPLPMILELINNTPETYIQLLSNCIVTILLFGCIIQYHQLLLTQLKNKRNIIPIIISFISIIITLICMIFTPMTTFLNKDFTLSISSQSSNTQSHTLKLNISTILFYYSSVILLNIHILSNLFIFFQTKRLLFLNTIKFKSKYIILIISDIGLLTSFIMCLYTKNHSFASNCGVIDWLSIVLLYVVCALHISDVKKIIQKDGNFMTKSIQLQKDDLLA